MGLYFNPGDESFKQAVNSPIYVDKSMLIQYLNNCLCSEGKCIALSHARRFGKSQAANMIDAYYSCGCDSRPLFEDLELAKQTGWDDKLNKFNVIHLDMSTLVGNDDDNLVEYIKETIYDDIKKDYPQIDFSRNIAMVLHSVYELSKAKVIVIIDEWDCVIRNYSHRPDMVHSYMKFLHDIYKSKEANNFLALGYITGILPIKKIKDESALNNFREFTMISSKQLTPFYGFTEAEVKELCQKYHMDFASVHKWYNGYLINGLHMYNPNSVYQSMLDAALDSYWRNTSAFSTINTYISLNFAGLRDDILKMLSGGSVPVRTDTFQNDLSVIRSKDEALTALIHLGYLGYNERRRQAFIPNYEVMTAFHSALETGQWQEIAKAVRNADELLFNTIDGEAELVAEKLDIAHEAYTSILQYNNENSLSCAITMAYTTAPAYYNIERELPAGKGFADMVFIPRRDAGDMPALLIELKYDQPADTAIRQIKEKRYQGRLSGYADKIMLVGVSYDKTTKHHTCVIEEYYAEK